MRFTLLTLAHYKSSLCLHNSAQKPHALKPTVIGSLSIKTHLDKDSPGTKCSVDAKTLHNTTVNAQSDRARRRWRTGRRVIMQGACGVGVEEPDLPSGPRAGARRITLMTYDTRFPRLPLAK